MLVLVAAQRELEARAVAAMGRLMREQQLNLEQPTPAGVVVVLEHLVHLSPRKHLVQAALA